MLIVLATTAEKPPGYTGLSPNKPPSPPGEEGEGGNQHERLPQKQSHPAASGTTPQRPPPCGRQAPETRQLQPSLQPQPPPDLSPAVPRIGTALACPARPGPALRPDRPAEGTQRPLPASPSPPDAGRAALCARAGWSEGTAPAQ